MERNILEVYSSNCKIIKYVNFTASYLKGLHLILFENSNFCLLIFLMKNNLKNIIYSNQK